MNNVGSLYLIVHDPAVLSSFDNEWHGGLLQSITTTPQIAKMCKEAQEKGETVFIHKCGPGMPSVICCSANVASVDLETTKVTFSNQKAFSEQPPITAAKGQSSYRA